MNQKTNNIGLDYDTVVECFANIVRTYIQFLALYFFYVFSLFFTLIFFYVFSFFFTLIFIDFIELFNFFHFKQDTHTKEKNTEFSLLCRNSWVEKEKERCGLVHFFEAKI